jgi:RNA polymerase sigma-70 factor (ECF subfamily)
MASDDGGGSTAAADDSTPADGGSTAAAEVLARLEAELPRLVRLATKLVRDPDVAEDLAQETLIAAWRNADRLRSPEALWSWLRRTLLNRVIDRSRARRDELDIEAVEADWRDDSFTVQPERVLEVAELREDLEDALARLPAIYRLPVVLHDALGWTALEIAASMGAGLPATKQRLRRGRMMLVSALAEDDARRRASLAQPMRCWRARRHVSAYLDGELDPGTVAAVEGHLAGCPTCPPLYAALVGVRARLEGLRDPDSVVEDAVAARVRAHVMAHVHADPADAAGLVDHQHASG